MDNQKLATLFLFSLLIASLLSLPILAVIKVGVKEGDWIEYNIAFIGTPTKGHDVVWARMEILNVKETSVTVKITSKFSGGKQDTSTPVLNLETGHLGDAFIIPANLETGDTFLDENRGNVTISGTKQKFVAGADRTLIYAVTAETTMYWDKATGIAVESHSAFVNFTMVTMTEKTNIWQPSLLGLEPTAFYALTATVLGAVLIIVALLVFPRRNGTPRHNQQHLK